MDGYEDDDLWDIGMGCGDSDCDDSAIDPAAAEIPGDGVDQDCDTADGVHIKLRTISIG